MFYIALAISFLLGAIPFAYLIPKLKGIDIRKVGSKNPGATNVRRVLGWKFGMLVLILDILKGMLAIYYITYYCPEKTIDLTSAQLLAGFLSIIGHTYSPFLKFRGGKGAATSLGVFLYLIPVPTLLAIFTFILSLKLFNFVSLSTIIASLSLLVWYFFLYYTSFLRGYSNIMLSVIIVILLLIIIRHRTNIRRLLDGTELKYRDKNKDK